VKNHFFEWANGCIRHRYFGVHSLAGAWENNSFEKRGTCGRKIDGDDQDDEYDNNRDDYLEPSPFSAWRWSVNWNFSHRLTVFQTKARREPVSKDFCDGLALFNVKISDGKQPPLMFDLSLRESAASVRSTVGNLVE